MERSPAGVRRWLSFAITDIAKIREIPAHSTYVVAYPKTGSTWLRFILAQMVIKGYDLPCELNANLNKIADDFPQYSLPRWTHDRAQMLRENGETIDPTILFAYGGRLKFIRSSVILVVRDPRDVVVSLYHQVTRRSENPMTFESMSAFIRHPYIGFARIIHFYKIWYGNRFIPRRLHIVRYEDLHTNGINTLTQLAQFLQLHTLTTADLEQIYDNSKADNMRKLEETNSVKNITRRNYGDDLNAKKVRKAKIGSYLDEMSADDIAYCAEKMRGFPAVFGYAPQPEQQA